METDTPTKCTEVTETKPSDAPHQAMPSAPTVAGPIKSAPTNIPISNEDSQGAQSSPPQQNVPASAPLEAPVHQFKVNEPEKMEIDVPTSQPSAPPVVEPKVDVAAPPVRTNKLI